MTGRILEAVKLLARVRRRARIVVHDYGLAAWHPVSHVGLQVAVVHPRHYVEQLPQLVLIQGRMRDHLQTRVAFRIGIVSGDLQANATLAEVGGAIAAASTVVRGTGQSIVVFGIIMIGLWLLRLGEHRLVLPVALLERPCRARHLLELDVAEALGLVRAAILDDRRVLDRAELGEFLLQLAVSHCFR